ncbi:MAG: S-adenosylmethionine:tRNA ribosyltransferase-isomerase [Planctomycetota bacterium]
MFDYELPPDKIARYPAQPPDSCKLLIYNKNTKQIIDERFFNLPQYIDSNCVLVFNNTKVQPVRIEYSFENGEKGDFLIYKIVNEKEVNILTKLRGKNFPVVLYVNGKKLGSIVGRSEFGFKLILEEKVWYIIEQYGTMPIPPYLKRQARQEDKKWYQPVFARQGFSIACPTASLHFTEDLVKKLRGKGIEMFFLRLDVYFSTIFEEERLPPDLAGEYYEIGESDFKALLERKKEGKKIIAVGTTVCKALETVAITGEFLGISRLYIKAPFEFKITDAIITNFHRGKSPTLDLLCAFAGMKELKELYEYALVYDYKFLSYGDAMFIF